MGRDMKREGRCGERGRGRKKEGEEGRVLSQASPTRPQVKCGLCKR